MGIILLLGVSGVVLEGIMKGTGDVRVQQGIASST